jgi:hypothetical protein
MLSTNTRRCAARVWGVDFVACGYDASVPLTRFLHADAGLAAAPSTRERRRQYGGGSLRHACRPGPVMRLL